MLRQLTSLVLVVLLACSESTQVAADAAGAQDAEPDANVAVDAATPVDAGPDTSGFPIPAAGTEPFGIDVEDLRIDEVDALLDKAQSTGAQWLRFLLMWRWSELVPPVRTPSNTPGQWAGVHTYQWDHWDALVDGSIKRGMKVYLNVIWPPAWANGNPNDCDPIVPTDCKDLSGGYVITNKLDLQDYYYNAAVHFKGRVSYYGVWNEPNLRNMFNPVGADDANYLSIFVDTYLKTANTAIRLADPAAKIVAPDLSDRCGVPSTCAAKTGWYDSWLLPLWTNQKSLFDVVSVHRYDHNADQVQAAVEQAHALIGGQELWLTEAGWNAKDPAFQAAQACAMFADTINRGSWWTRTFYHSLNDDASNEADFGIFHSKAFTPPYAPQPILTTYQHMVQGDPAACTAK